jgi:tRNA-Thr(GGU) m(6)t(6)A37 methyltransferase TsaA
MNTSQVGPLRVIGEVASTLRHVEDAPRQPDEGAPPASLSIRPELADAMGGLEPGDRILILTWLHLADRQVLVTRPRNEPARPPTGVFATRSPARPNPIGLHETTITGIRGTEIEVAELEAVDGTPIIDIKPALGPAPGR